MPTLYDNFERVRQYIDQHQGGGGDMSAYVTKDELSAQSYLTSIPSTYASYNGVYSYLNSIGIYKKNNGGSNIDSAVITDSELSGDIVINDISTWELPTYAAISNMGYITMGDVSACGYLTSIPSEYVTDTELSSALGNYYTDGEVDNEIISALSFYYTKTEINNASYVTSSDLPVIDENIIPKETGTYTLGDASHIYAATYSNKLIMDEYNMGLSADNQYVLDVNINTQKRYSFGGSGFFPQGNNKTLGTSSAVWAATYTSNLYADTAYLQDTSYTKSIVPAENNTYTLGDSSHLYNSAYISALKFNNYENQFYGAGQYTITCKINGANRYSFMAGSIRPEITNVDLGTSSNKWKATYTANIYADNAYISNIHNFIWTGTSAEYAALSDYTTYQIYMIKEA